MSSLNGILNNKINCNANISTLNPQVSILQEQLPDSVELSNKKSKKKKIGIAAALSTLATAAIALACMIGRNPAKAAKVLKGSSNIMDDADRKSTRLNSSHTE